MYETHSTQEVNLAFLASIHLPEVNLEFTPIWNGEASLEYGADLGVTGEAKGKSMASNFTNNGARDSHLTLEALAIELEVTLELNLEEDKNMGCTLVVGDNNSPQ